MNAFSPPLNPSVSPTSFPKDEEDANAEMEDDTNLHQRWKLVVRHLPPTLPESIFWETVKDWLPETIFSQYVQGHLPRKSRTKPATWGRAYLVFTSQDKVQGFYQQFHGHVFLDSTGTKYPIHVSLALNQGLPSDHLPKRNHQSWINTLHREKGYAAFLKTLAAKEQGISLPENVVLEQQTPPPVTSPETTTPLIEFLKKKKKNPSSAPTLSTNSKKKASSTLSNPAASFNHKTMTDTKSTPATTVVSTSSSSSTSSKFSSSTATKKPSTANAPSILTTFTKVPTLVQSTSAAPPKSSEKAPSDIGKTKERSGRRRVESNEPSSLEGKYLEPLQHHRPRSSRMGASRRPREKSPYRTKPALSPRPPHPRSNPAPRSERPGSSRHKEKPATSQRHPQYEDERSSLKSKFVEDLSMYM